MKPSATLYDYAIIGAGAAGAMLAKALLDDPFFKDKTILILDKDDKTKNDRTWCYWENGKGPFDHLVSYQWDRIFFGGQRQSREMEIAPYSYKMIRGLDFYEAYLPLIKAAGNTTFVQAAVKEVFDEGHQVSIQTGSGDFRAQRVFNSIFNYGMTQGQHKYPVLQQHFIGWFVKTEQPVFDAGLATYMDFSVPQDGQTRFMYVLPTAPDTALLEYTLFSHDTLPKEAYEKAIKDYLKERYHTVEYTLTDVEMGNIPMTCYDFSDHHSPNVRYIGTAGGWAKASTGYTFMSTAKKIPKLVAFLKTGRPLDQWSFKNKFWYYDLLFLDVLDQDNAHGYQIFESLFTHMTPFQIFKFLDEETSLWEDFKTILASPKLPFTKALVKRLFKPS